MNMLWNQNSGWNSDGDISSEEMRSFARKIKTGEKFVGDKRLSTFFLASPEEESALNFLLRNKVVKSVYDIAHKFGGLYDMTTVEILEGKSLLELCEQPTDNQNNNALIDEEFFEFKELSFKLKLPTGGTNDLNFSSYEEHPYYLFSVLISLLRKKQRKENDWIAADITNAEIAELLASKFPSEKLSWSNKWISDTKHNLKTKMKSQSYESFFDISNSKFQNGKRFRTIKLKSLE